MHLGDKAAMTAVWGLQFLEDRTFKENVKTLRMAFLAVGVSWMWTWRN